MVQTTQISEAGHYNPKIHSYFYDDEENIIKLNYLSGNHIITYVDITSTVASGQSGYIACLATSSNGGPLQYEGYIYVLDTIPDYYFSCSKTPNKFGSLEILPKDDWPAAVLMSAYVTIGPPPKKH